MRDFETLSKVRVWKMRGGVQGLGGFEKTLRVSEWVVRLGLYWAVKKHK